MEIACAAAVLALVAGCGGGGGGATAPAPPPVPPPVIVTQYTLGGTVTGLGQGASVTLANGSEKLVVGTNGAFTFATKLDTGAAYNITVTAPAGYSCKATDAAGTMGSANSSKTTVSCLPLVLAGVQTALQTPVSVVADGAGSAYVFDDSLQSIMKVEPSGAITLVAGGQGKFGMADGSGSAARFHSLGTTGLLLDAQGNLFFADVCNGAIRKVVSGVVSTLAGKGSTVCNNVLPKEWVPQDVDGVGTAAGFEAPRHIVSDGAGGVYVLKYMNQLGVRHVSAAGVVTTRNWSNPAEAPDGVILQTFARSAGGIFYVSEGRRIWKEVNGELVLVAGNLTALPTKDGLGAAAQFGGIASMVVAPSGDLYVAELAAVRKVTPQGQVTTIAGHSEARGFADGQGAAAQFTSLSAISLDGPDLLVLDTDQKTLRKVTLDGKVTTLAATPPSRGLVDGAGGAARLNASTSLAADADGNLLFVDGASHVIRKATLDGTVTTIAGKSGVLGRTDGPVESALFATPVAVAASADGAIWVGERTALRRIANGVVTTVDPFMQVKNLTVDAAGNAIVTSSSSVFRVTPAGVKTTLITAFAASAVAGNEPGIFVPQAVAVDAGGNIYVADTSSVVVFKLTPAGVVSVFAGTPLKEKGDIDGPVGTATLGFYRVEYLTIDDKGNLYLSGQGGVRMISPGGVVSSPSFGWGNAVIGPLAFSKGKLYGVTRYALLQTWLP